MADSYNADRSQLHTFGPRGAAVFDVRCLKTVGVSSAQLTTTRGRLSFSLAHGGKQRAQLAAGAAVKSLRRRVREHRRRLQSVRTRSAFKRLQKTKRHGANCRTPYRSARRSRDAASEGVNAVRSHG